MALLLLLLASGISDGDANAVVMYAQSYTTPAIFEVCKTSVPDKATEFDVALDNWKRANKRVVARGERVARSHAKKEGTDLDAMFSAERDSMISELKLGGWQSPAMVQRYANLGMADLQRYAERVQMQKARLDYDLATQ